MEYEYVGPGSLNKSDIITVCGYGEEHKKLSQGRPQSLNHTIDIGLDRQSFIDRGWTDAQLGRWNNGATQDRKGLFLSMFYALQMNNPSIGIHPWNEGCNDWDRGLGAHIDFWTKDKHGFPYQLYVYDYPVPPKRQGVIVGRTSNEAPFAGGGPCSIPNAIGCAGGGSDLICVNTSASFSLGRRIDDLSIVLDNDGQHRINLTYLLAHEVGHFYGFDHINDSSNIMFPSIGGNNLRPKWQTPEGISNPMFWALADALDQGSKRQT
jgi:hypothetical protein